LSSTETYTMPGYVGDGDGLLARLRRIEGWVAMGPTIRDGRADQLDAPKKGSSLSALSKSTAVGMSRTCGVGAPEVARGRWPRISGRHNTVRHSADGGYRHSGSRR
jgi:hypothetical protein